MEKISTILTPLQLRFYEVDEVHLKANPEWLYEDGNPPLRQIEVDFDFFSRENDGEVPMYHFVVIIQVNRTPTAFDAADYRGKVVLRTYFSYDPTEEERETYNRIVLPNGLAMTYSIARGIIASITGNGRHGPLFLPTVNMHEVIHRKLAAAERKMKKTKRK